MSARIHSIYLEKGETEVKINKDGRGGNFV